jgi:hypothetical protein
MPRAARDAQTTRSACLPVFPGAGRRRVTVPPSAPRPPAGRDGDGRPAERGDEGEIHRLRNHDAGGGEEESLRVAVHTPLRRDESEILVEDREDVDRRQRDGGGHAEIEERARGDPLEIDLEVAVVLAAVREPCDAVAERLPQFPLRLVRRPLAEGVVVEEVGRREPGGRAALAAEPVARDADVVVVDADAVGIPVHEGPLEELRVTGEDGDHPVGLE